jgi:murein DD-endopeptidase MepM/ murein hydrolase activator NlpD
MRSAGFLILIAAGPLFVLAQTAAPVPETSETVQVGPSREDLETRIKEKSDALEKVNQELQKTEEHLQSTQAEKSSLQRELTKLQSNIGQLELGIRADTIAGEKLGLEIESLQYDIRDTERTVADKTSAIGHLLRELQQRGNEDLLVIFLRNTSLAESVWETQTLKNFRFQLAADISSLTNLQTELSTKLKLVSSKKNDVEVHQQALSAKKSLVEDQKQTRSVVLQQTKSKETEYQKQLAALKEQQESISDEISDIEEELRLKFDVGLLPAKRPGVFGWPVQMVSDGGKGRITQHYGEVSRLYRGKPHNGLDIGAPVGTPVLAAEDGIVTRVDNNDRSSWSKYQYGKYILIKHGNNLTTLYAHLSKFAVQAGQQVKRGEVIGYVGATGYATGAHLHFGVYWSASVQLKSVPPAAGLVPIGVIVQPEDYL